MGRDSFSFGATVTVAFDEDWLRVMQEAIKQSGSHGGIAGEDSGPVLEGDVGRNDDRAALVAFGDDLKEQLCAPLVQGQISQFVDDQYFWALVMLDLPGELAIGFGGAKPVNHVNGGGKEHAMAAQAGCIAQSDGQMAFSDPGGTGEDNVGAGVDEVQLQEVFDLHAVDLGGPVPIPSGHGFGDREAGVMDAALDASVMAQGDFAGDEFLKVLEVTVAVASGLFGGLHGIFEYVSQTQAAEVVLESGVWPSGRRIRRRSF